MQLESNCTYLGVRLFEGVRLWSYGPFVLQVGNYKIYIADNMFRQQNGLVDPLEVPTQLVGHG